MAIKVLMNFINALAISECIENFNTMLGTVVHNWEMFRLFLQLLVPEVDMVYNVPCYHNNTHYHKL